MGQDPGSFIPWIESDVAFGRAAANKYMGLYQHRDKIASSANLSQAHKQVETLKKQAARAEKKRVKAKVSEHKEAGTATRKGQT